MLVISGFAIFVMLFAASYTGSTAAVLIADSGNRAAITGLADVAAMPGSKICLLQTSKKRFVLRYPQVPANVHLYPCDNSRNVSQQVVALQFEGRTVTGITTDDVLQDFDDERCKETGGGRFNM